ncbi:Family S53 protease [Mycena venus]|uniref:Family S53 protease n=1 Tax=Mycena venus TaxID=2733690 RepID=A0A8H6YR67_9AGAR|nr:Family S53 protease [Mycena venus]
MSATALFLASLLSLAAAGPAFQNFVVQESLAGAPQGFAKVGPATDPTPINLRIALASSNFAGLEKALYDVSTPSSVNYGNHLSKDEANAFLAPSDDAVAAVQAWLTSYGLVATKSNGAGDWLSVTVPVSKANEMLSAKYETFEHVASGKTYARTLSYALPVEIADHVAAIHPTSTFNNPESLRPVLSAPKPASGIPTDATPSCATTLTPACLQSLYGIPTTRATESSNTIAVSGFIEQYANKADLTSFLKKFRTDISSSTTFTLQTLDGGSDPQTASKAGVEANLDIQYTVGVATGVPVFFVSVGENFQDGDLEGFLDIVNFLLGEENVPLVMTTSYGQNENTISKSLALYALSLANYFIPHAKLIVTANSARRMPLWVPAEPPSSSRAVTVVSRVARPRAAPSTRPPSPPAAPTSPPSAPSMVSPPETASTFSSGGFSNYWGGASIPFTSSSQIVDCIVLVADYQSSAVSAFLTAQGTTNKGLFNASGRGYPDVSAQGENVEIVSDGQTGTVAGTSCSSPIFASVIGLINDRLIAAGHSPLRFLNPWLYANPGMLNDVTTGSNPGCGAKGFTARAGWDPVTGLGTPNFAKMLAAAGL